jgi:hypothetical protein
MTTARVIKDNENPEVKHLMRSIINSHSSLGVVRFFAAHPRGRFSRLAIVHALDETDTHRDIEGAMTDLVEADVLKETTENMVCYLRLTPDDPVRGIVLKTAEMDWRQWHLVFARV